MGHAEHFKSMRHENEVRSQTGDPIRSPSGLSEQDAQRLARAASIRANLMAYHPHQALGLRLKGRIG